MMRKIFSSVLCCGAVLLLQAQPRLPQNYYWTKLANGLEVVAIEDSRVPLATIEIAVKNGAYTEGAEYSGLSHLFEHMFFKANRDYPDQQKLVNRIQELGAVFNGTTGDERVNYFFTFDRDSLAAGLKFMNSAIRFPVYRVEDMQKERPVVDGEFQRMESDPGSQLWLESAKRVWGDLFTRKNAIGDHTIINTATPEKMMIIKDKYYYPNNAMLVVTGDVKHDAVFALAQQIYGDWKPSDFDPFQKYPIPDFKPLEKTDYFIKESSIAQTPMISMTWQGPDTRNDSAATIAADIFSTALSLNSSKWRQALIDKGLATSADVTYQTSRYVGPIEIDITPNPTKMKECFAEVMNQISHFADPDYLTDDQLETAKEKVKRNQIRRNERPSGLGRQLTYYWTSASLNYFTDYQANLSKVTRDDIANYTRKYIVGKPYVAGMIINKEMNSTLKPSDYFKTKEM